MIENKTKCNRIIGLDMHPDVFAAAAVENADAATAKILWIHDRQKTAQLERWAQKHLQPGDILLLEASGNSFEVASRLHRLGFTALVLESAQAGKLRDNFCNDDRHSAVKVARIYLSGLAKLVWQPDERTREYREVFFAHRNAVKDTTRCRNRIRSFLNEHCVRLPVGTRLTQASGLKRALELYGWNPLQRSLIEDKFTQLWECESRRKRLEQVMVAELIERPEWGRLWRMMGIRHRVAFGLMAMIGNVHRFATAKKLVGYLGLAPRKNQSGNDPDGRVKGIGKTGRGDLRTLLMQSAQNALNQRSSPLHKWGWKLQIKKNRNIATAAVARKLTVSIWHLLKGHFTPLIELDDHIKTKLLKLATVLGKKQLKTMGYNSRSDFSHHIFKLIQIST